MRRNSDIATNAVVLVAALVVVGLLAWGGWHVKRWFNYNWGYQSQVQAEVCHMVKRSALYDPSLCD